ncbi:hypothetical protein L211DRAFT_84616 [Terfezia boudieri ATCC MYA-4762]|uniref:U1-type domain-containing protein n=1 Tax=Terfezia boudieri ATCC MYA-4762 TaxID=1051890 RepID=A0A3N4LRE8_9PEZI|nr:hypothetical protein L211DRAFT_84616 [Terfezia boudieri ATCC MYA-4762]
MRPSAWFCQPCNRTLLVTADTRDLHIHGKKHTRNVTAAAREASVTSETDGVLTLVAQGGWKCNICPRAGVMDCVSKQAHLEGKKHLARIAVLAKSRVDKGKQSHLVETPLNRSGVTGGPLIITPADTTLKAFPWGKMPNVRRCGPTELQAVARGLQATSGGTRITSTPIRPPISDTKSACDSQRSRMPPKKMHMANRGNEPTYGYCIYKLGSTIMPPRPVAGPTAPGCRQRLICVTGQGRTVSTRYSTPNIHRLRPRKPGQPKQGVYHEKDMPAAMYPRKHSGITHSQRINHPGSVVMNQKMAWRTHTCSRRRPHTFEVNCCADGFKDLRPMILRRRNPLIQPTASRKKH